MNRFDTFEYITVTWYQIIVLDHMTGLLAISSIRILSNLIYLLNVPLLEHRFELTAEQFNVILYNFIYYH